MKIDIQYVQMPTSESMNAFVSKKLNKLAKKYDWIIRAQVYFKQGNEHSGKDKICEIELSVPGPRLFARSDEAYFEKAAVSSIDDLERQLRKRKEAFSKH